MKKLLFAMMLATVAGTSMAQDAAIKKARAAFDQSSKTEEYKNEAGQKAMRIVTDWAKVEEAQNLLTPVFTNEKTKKFLDAWLLQSDIHDLYFRTELNKMVAVLQGTSNEPYDLNLMMDKLTATLDAFYKVMEYDTKNTNANIRQNFSKFRGYYLNIGQVYADQKNNSGACTAFELWLNFPQRYPNADAELMETSGNGVNRGQIAFFAALSAYNAKEYERMGAFEADAMTYEEEISNVRSLFLYALQQTGDMEGWAKKSEEMVLNGTAPEGTLQNVLKYYMDENKDEALITFAQKVCDELPTEKWGPFAMGLIYQNKEQWAESAEWFKKACEIDPTFVQGLRGAALAIYNAALAMYDQIPTEFKNVAERDKAEKPIKDKCLESASYFEKVRELEPENPGSWAYNLRQIYSILGDKEKIEEISAYCE